MLSSLRSTDGSGPRESTPQYVQTVPAEPKQHTPQTARPPRVTVGDHVPSTPSESTFSAPQTARPQRVTVGNSLPSTPSESTFSMPMSSRPTTGSVRRFPISAAASLALTKQRMKERGMIQRYGWHPCEQEVLQSLRVAGAGLKSLASCMVGSRLCELHLDARVEIDILTGKRRRLRITSPSEADVATAAVAQGGASELPDRPQPAREVAAIETAKPKKTLSRYFTKEKKEDGDPKIGNEKIASIFEEMSVVQRLKRDRFRSQAYAKAAQALRALAEPIDSGAQAKAIKGIGAGMANRIDVILKTGELKELEELKLDSDVVALRELRSVHGIGAVSAAKLVERGIRSLAQLRDAVEKNQVHLDSAQALGLRHCEEFSKRIPQAAGEVGFLLCSHLPAHEAEMKEHHKLLEQCCLKGHPDLLLTVCGSYRRGRPDCGDIEAWS
eukprot:g12775.t1